MPRIAKADSDNIPVEITLEGQYLGPNGPVHFTATRSFELVLPGYAVATELAWYGDTVQVTKKNNQWVLNLKVSNKAASGIGLDLNFNSTVARGRIYGLNLVNELVFRSENDKHIVIASTNGQYWYDGSDYPYTEVETISEPGAQEFVQFRDTPDFALSTAEEKADYVWYSFQALTYFFYDDEANVVDPVHPVLVGQPVHWGYETLLAFEGEDQGFELSNTKIWPCSKIDDVELPVWNHHIPSEGQNPANQVL